MSGGPGRHIAFVGVDGAGKSTQAGRLVRRLRTEGRPARLLEPGPQVGVELLRRVAVDAGETLLDHWGVDAALTVQAIDGLRSQAIVPLLTAAGDHVVSVKGLAVRRAHAAALGAARPDRIAALVALGDAPDITVHLRLEPAVALERIAARGIDEEDPAALTAFGAALHELAAAEGWATVDAAASEDEVAEAVWAAVRPILDRDRCGA